MNYPALLNIIQEEITFKVLWLMLFYNIYIYVEKNPTYVKNVEAHSKNIALLLQKC